MSNIRKTTTQTHTNQPYPTTKTNTHNTTSQYLCIHTDKTINAHTKTHNQYTYSKTQQTHNKNIAIQLEQNKTNTQQTHNGKQQPNNNK